MFISRKTIRTSTLANFCRFLGNMLHSGVDLIRSLDTAMEKAVDAQTREVLQRVRERIVNGQPIADALQAEDPYFPKLFVAMVALAEQSGKLPEVLLHLAEHYEKMIELRRTFISGIAWPVFEFIAALLVIALLILILGLVVDEGRQSPVDFMTFGLRGPTGAMIWLGSWAVLIALGFATFLLVRKLSRGHAFDRFLLKLPVIGKALQSFAIARFSWAYYLTQQSGMPIQQCLQASLRATNNRAYMAAFDTIWGAIRDGSDLSVALRKTGLFPEEYLHVVAVAETSGTVPEELHRLSPQFEEEARRNLRAVTRAFGVTIWVIVAAFIISFILRFFIWYVDQLNQQLRMIH